MERDLHVLLLGAPEVPHVCLAAHIQVGRADDQIVHADRCGLQEEPLLVFGELDVLLVLVDEFHASLCEACLSIDYGVSDVPRVTEDCVGCDGRMMRDLLCDILVLTWDNKLECFS